MLGRISQRVAREQGGGGAKAWGEITRLASSGNIVADLGQGYPDFKGNAAALKSASETLLSSVKENQYSLIHGHEGLRQSLASFYASQYPSGIKFSAENQIVVTSSGTEALFSCMQALIDPGDEVIVFEPFFPWYIPSVRMAGGVPKVITLAPPDFEINAEFVESQISSKTKMIIVNSPHNPTGHVCSLPELQGVCKLAVKHDLMVVSDEVYECFVWGDGMRHHRVCDIKGMEDRTITIGSSSKMFSLTGFRVGWVYGQESLVNAVKACHAYSTCKSKENTFYFVNDETDCAPTPLQVGIENALQNYQAEQSVELSKKFKKNAEILARALLQLNVKCLLPDGGYFLIGDISGTEHATDLDFCRWLAEEKNVIAVPMSVFYHNDPKPQHLVRFAICKTEETMLKAADALT